MCRVPSQTIYKLNDILAIANMNLIGWTINNNQDILLSGNGGTRIMHLCPTTQ